MNPRYIRSLAIAALSATASLTHAAHLTLADDPLWTVAAGAATHPFIANDNAHRGLAYNPTTGNVLVASRTPDQAGVYILNGQTGAVVGNLNISGISGGTFPFSMLGIGDDGAIYTANLTTNSSTSPLKVYRWASETAGLTTGDNAAPTLIYQGNPLGGTTVGRFGDSLNVFGSGANTQIALGTRAAVDGNLTLALLTPSATDPAQFAAQPVTATGINAGTVSIAFEDADTVWVKNNGAPARQLDIAGSTATLGGSFTPAKATTGVIGVDDASNLLGLIKYQTSADAGDWLYLYDITDPNAVAEITTRPFATDPVNTNSNSVGSIAFGDNVVYALDTNNGIIAYQIVAVPEPAALTFVALGAAALLGRRRR